MDDPFSPRSWLRVTPEGLFCVPGGFYVDPVRPVARAVVTHAHADHARPGHERVLATPATLAIMEARLGPEGMGQGQALAYGRRVKLGDVTVTLLPAGHILGSAQVLLSYRGFRVVVSGDFKRREDPTCTPFEADVCDLFVTEATFGLPVFRHPPVEGEIAKLLRSLALFPERCHLVGVYAVGKCQRVLALLRRAGYDEPVYLHATLLRPSALYERLGVPLGPIRPITGTAKEGLQGRIVLAPPSALADPWTRRLPDPVVCLASGWMGVRARARQRGVELPLVISDHADWDELTATLHDVGCTAVWVTHGREEALVHYARTRGLEAEALALVGYEEEGE